MNLIVAIVGLYVCYVIGKALADGVKSGAKQWWDSRGKR